MTCAPTDRLMQTLRVHVPGVTDPMLQLELFNVMDEFFRRTNAWQYRTQVTLLDGLTEYGFTIPVDATVIRTLGVLHREMPVLASSTGTGASVNSIGRLIPSDIYPDGDAQFPYETSDINPSGVFTYAIYKPEYITLSAPPDEEAILYPLEMALALTIAKTCLECDCNEWQLDDWMYDAFFQDWYDGTLGRLYGMPAKPWTSATLAQYHGKRFRNKMAFRMQESRRGYAYNVPAWRFPRGGWVG